MWIVVRVALNGETFELFMTQTEEQAKHEAARLKRSDEERTYYYKQRVKKEND